MSNQIIDPHSGRPFTLAQRVKAWSVHAFTMTGVMWAVFALLALFEGRTGWMWVWLGIALIVDAIDGTFARRCRVSEVVPWFDGVILDDIVDYLTWTFIPAIFMYLYIPLGPKPLAAIMTIVIVASSMFCYANKGMKAEDNYFVGFPAAWNIVAIYFIILGTGPVFNVIATLIIAALTLSRLTFVHPLRVRALMPVNIVAAICWLVSTTWLLVVVNDQPLWLQIIWWLSGIYFLVVGIIRTALGRRGMAKFVGLESA
ncbi:phosphatidylcholine synthase [Boudabousia tangfeifanii]|uniref:Phosphatidylcholine synthase n=1 Tax=Boudabousia tangfeifanii TaxID=1912795 RepID=A0A1D9MK25_9ACTO|nr:CDP-alcohol phosphatidyltransferase family protein [Boudabousia tangfeifanii]AOZ72533.1 phosphatidylcholine synthase [Boudabousia tangfeifanii]